MKNRRLMSWLLCACLLTPLTGCKGAAHSPDSEESSTANPEESGSADSGSSSEPLAETAEAMRFTAQGVTKTPQRFLKEQSQLVLTAPEGAEIYYTLDGSVPDKKNAEKYTEPICIKTRIADFPVCTVLRAKAYFADGSESVTATQTFWAAGDIDTAFHNPVISLTGEPAELTEKPDGIFYGENAKKTGRSSERAVSVEFVDDSGSELFAQDAGLRIYGKASRESSIKSVKLYARKSYDEAHGKFAYDGFGTADAEGGVIGKYDKLVVRNAGNDFQFAFIRDELNQTLAAEAGYTDCEGVLPVVVYLNGSYYGMHWLHESICDDLLKDKYGGNKLGKFVILEGREREKTVPKDDDETAAAAEAFEADYEAFSALDLTDDKNYQKVCEWMDVENYLDYFAFNVCINNKDWPQGNQKLYRFAADSESGYDRSEGSRLDGRWRFWIHDTDYAEGLYEQTETQAEYNNLAQILDEKSNRYAPLFAALMQREDCKSHFREKVRELMHGTLSSEHIIETLDRLNADRFSEMQRYFKHLEKLKQSDSSIWIWYQGYQEQTKMIRTFAVARERYMEDFLTEALGDDADTETDE
ncbi:MAG: CotH kinase family protein [Oscillospiraceae bacterium]|nr:CotH kinase family protein [Oscillospiraceae bacterium]